MDVKTGANQDQVRSERQGDGYIVVKAESFGRGPFGMVTRRADQGEGVAHPIGMDCFDRPAQSPGCRLGHFVG